MSWEYVECTNCSKEIVVPRKEKYNLCYECEAIEGGKSMEPVRVNTRISSDLNNWLDKKSLEMAISKSALINIAVENYRKEVETITNLPKLLEKLKELGLDLDN